MVDYHLIRVMLNEIEYQDIGVDDYWNNIFLIAESLTEFIKSFKILKEDQSKDVGSIILSEKMSDNFIARMLAARAELEAKEKAKKIKG